MFTRRNQGLSGRAAPPVLGGDSVFGKASPLGGASSPLASSFELLQQAAEAMQVGREHGEGDGALEAIGAAASDTVEAAMLQSVDGRLDCRMRTPCGGEGFTVLPLPIGARQIPLLRQDVEIKNLVKPDAVCWGQL